MDSIAKQYYKIVEFYQEPEELNSSNSGSILSYFEARFPFEKEENIIHIAQTFYESVKYEHLYKPYKNRSKSILEIIEQQKKGVEYLKQNITEALLCEEKYIRELAKLIYTDMQEESKKKKKK